jgi:putative N-acetyltransferase (TIGR04045 family)
MSATGVGHPRAVGSDTIVCRPAGSAAELAQHRFIRHQVFVREQAVFVDSDLDEHDRAQATICLLGFCGGLAAGGVRLYELDRTAGLWQGDRLAVLPRFRTSGVGGPLVRCAVATAGARGGREMMAHIQLPNVGFFRRLGWSAVGETEVYAGLPHQQMHIALPDPDRGAALVAELAHGT